MSNTSKQCPPIFQSGQHFLGEASIPLRPPGYGPDYHPYVLEFIHLLRCIPLTCNIHCILFVQRHNTSVFLVLIFILSRSHAAENQSSACRRPYWEDASSTKSSAKSKRLILKLTNVTPSSTRLWLSIQFMYTSGG